MTHNLGCLLLLKILSRFSNLLYIINQQNTYYSYKIHTTKIKACPFDTSDIEYFPLLNIDEFINSIPNLIEQPSPLSDHQYKLKLQHRNYSQNPSFYISCF